MIRGYIWYLTSFVQFDYKYFLPRGLNHLRFAWKFTRRSENIKPLCNQKTAFDWNIHLWTLLKVVRRLKEKMKCHAQINHFCMTHQTNYILPHPLYFVSFSFNEKEKLIYICLIFSCLEAHAMRKGDLIDWSA